MDEFFHQFASAAARKVGSSWAFIIAVSIVLVWSITGPMFHYSDTWQLVINTGTTIITFLMVFLIQNTQNRDAKAIHLKLDELIRSIKEARNSMVDLEEMSDQDLNELKNQFQRLRKRHGDSGAALKALRNSVEDALSEKSRK